MEEKGRVFQWSTFLIYVSASIIVLFFQDKEFLYAFLLSGNPSVVKKLESCLVWEVSDVALVCLLRVVSNVPLGHPGSPPVLPRHPDRPLQGSRPHPLRHRGVFQESPFVLPEVLPASPHPRHGVRDPEAPPGPLLRARRPPVPWPRSSGPPPRFRRRRAALRQEAPLRPSPASLGEEPRVRSTAKNKLGQYFFNWSIDRSIANALVFPFQP